MTDKLNGEFVSLHNHSPYSLLDGFVDMGELLDKCKKTNMPAVAVTDHGNLHGMYKFYSKATKAGIKPIIGMEAYMCLGDMSTKDMTNKDNYHQVIWCKNNTGLKNLYKLSTLAYTEGFYGKPRFDFELLEKHREGLIVTSSCLAGFAPQYILEDKQDEAEKVLAQYKEAFGDDFYLEVQFNGLADQNKVNEFMKKMNHKLKIEMVATSDGHYLNEEDWEYHDMILAMQTKTTIDNEKRFKFPGKTFFIHTPKQMKMLSNQYPGAYENTVKIAEKCNVEIKRDKWIFPHVEGYSDEKFTEKCIEALKVRLGKKNIPEDKKEEVWGQYKSRLDYELSVILKQGYGPYFEVVSDYCGWARNQGILMSPARGSAGGCLVAYATEISDIDPVQYNLPFARFLNPERVSPPDIDSDFQDDRREEVIEYLRKKYGEDCVAQVVKFGTMGIKTATHKVVKSLGYKHSVGEEMIEECYPLEKEKRGHVLELKDITDSPECLKKINANEDYKKIFRYVKRITEVDMIDNSGVNASGIVITDKPVMEYMPLYYPPKTKEDGSGILCTQLDKFDIEELGAIKFDILGLKTLAVIDKTLKYVEKLKGVKLPTRIEEYDMGDQAVYEALHSWKSLTGCFQIDQSDGFLMLIKRLKPKSIYDLADIISLWRPGPIDTGLVEEYIDAKNGVKIKPYVHESVKPFMEQTGNNMVYQEQLMSMAQVLAGYSLGEADLLRRAIGKKDLEKMKELRSGFIGKAVNVGIIGKEKAEEVFTDFEKYADYCLVGDTKIATEKGFFTIQEIVESKMNINVYSLDETGRVFFQPVVQYWDKGPKETFRYTFSDGTYIDSTNDHKIMIENGSMEEIQTIYNNKLNVKNISTKDPIVTIIKVQPLGVQNVYDIGLEKVHNFILHNSKIVSNCFNASHGYAYSLNTYWTMWLRHYYPMEFLVSQMNVYLSDEKDMAKLIKEAKAVGIKVLMPDFRYSNYECTIEGGDSIRIGLGAIKGIGESIDEYLSSYRAADLDPMDFIQIHKRSIGSKKIMAKKYMQALVYAGAFDYIGKHRTELFKTYEFYEDNVVKKYKNKDYPIRLHFMSESEAGYVTLPDNELESAADLELKLKELMPFRSFGAKLEGFEDILYDELKMWPISDLEPAGKRTFRVPGIVSDIYEFPDRKKNTMAKVTIEDSFGASATAMIFASVWENAKETCEIGKGVCLDCTVGEYKGKISINANRVSSLKKILSLHLQ